MKRRLIISVMIAMTLVGCGNKDESAKQAGAALPAAATAMSADLLVGRWTSEKKDAKIEVTNKNELLITNEIGAPSKGEIRNGDKLFAFDWNVSATLSGDGKQLNWSNGSTWTR